MVLSAWLLVAVIIILAGLVVYMYRELSKSESAMSSLQSVVAFNIADKNKKQRGLDQDIVDLKNDVSRMFNKLADDITALRLGLEAAHNKASTADFVAHSAKQEIMRMASMRIVHVHKHVITRKKKKKVLTNDQATEDVLNRISLQMNELNQ